jgi:hypothetical protein
MSQTNQIPGYTFGTSEAARSPLADEDLAAIQETLSWTADDEDALRRAGEVLTDQVQTVVGAWYDYIASLPQLVGTFATSTGEPDEGYLAAVRSRFEQWVRDLCSPPYGRDWLDYQEEIALRHHRSKKNLTDGVVSAADHVPLRYMISLIYPVTATIRDFLGAKGHSPDEVEAMHQAWFKAVVLSIALWARPYAEDW